MRVNTLPRGRAACEASGMPDTTSSTSSHGVSALFSHGRLTAIPQKRARREQLLVHLTQTLFERDRTYDES